MNEQEMNRLDDEAKKEMDDFRKQFNFIYRGNQHFYQIISKFYFILIVIIKGDILKDVYSLNGIGMFIFVMNF